MASRDLVQYRGSAGARGCRLPYATVDYLWSGCKMQLRSRIRVLSVAASLPSNLRSSLFGRPIRQPVCKAEFPQEVVDADIRWEHEVDELCSPASLKLNGVDGGSLYAQTEASKSSGGRGTGTRTG